MFSAAFSKSLLPQEIVQLLSWLFHGVYGITFESVEAEQVLGKDEQAGFSAGTVDASTVKPLKATMAFCVSKSKFHRLPA
jgi:hypothetical protein